MVRVDDEVVVHQDPPPETEPGGPQWLTIEPPRNTTATFQDILVSW